MEAVKASETEMRKRLGAQQQRQEQRAALVQDEHQEPVASAGDEGALVLRLAELHERALENFQVSCGIPRRSPAGILQCAALIP